MRTSLHTSSASRRVRLIERRCRSPDRPPSTCERPLSGPTLFADLVDTSDRVGEHAARRIKITRMAEFLRGLAPAEINIGVPYLAGVTRQGKSGIGYAMIAAA